MKLRITAALLVLLLVLAGCGPKTNNTSNQVPVNNTQTNTNQGQNTNQSTNTNNAANTNSGSNNTVDQKKKDQERYDAIYAAGIYNSDDLKFFLDGTWEMIPCGALPGTDQPFASLSFDKTTSKAELTVLTEDQPKVLMEFSTGKLFDTAQPSEDLIYLEVKDASEIIKKNSPQIIDTKNQFQILASRYKGDDIIALREVGNGTSYLAFDVLSHDNLTNDGFWMFVRVGGTKSSVVQDEAFDMSARYKKGTFYALRWVDLYGSCYLTPVNVEIYEDTFWTDKLSVLRYSYSNNGRALINVFYDIEGIDAGGKEGMLNPQLVEVTVDDMGQITDLKDHPYYSYGVYSVESGIVSHEEDYRDPLIYGETDKTYIGKWRASDNSGTELTVSEASLQVGGYSFDIKFGGTDTAACNANIYEGDLIVNQGYVNGTYDFECALMKSEKGIKMVVTSSKWDKMPSGTTIEFVKK